MVAFALMVEPTVFHLTPIARDLDTLPEAIANRIDREFRATIEQLHPAFPALLRGMVQVAAVTWKAVKRLCIDKHHGMSPPAELAITVPPLSRTLVESLMTTVFLFEDVHDRTNWYLRGGWREVAEHHERLQGKYASKPEWADWLNGHKQWVDGHQANLKLTAAELASPALATLKWGKGNKGYWPNPGKMVGLVNDPGRRAFLEMIREWFFGRLSEDSHLSYMGMARRWSVLFNPAETREQSRQNAILSTLVFYVALLSEVAISAGLAAEMVRLRGVWQHIIAYPTAADLWAARYEALLAEPAQPAP